MEKCTLFVNFKNLDNKVFQIRVNDVRPDITRQEAEAIADLIVSNQAIKYKEMHVAQYLGSQIEIISTEIL